MMKYSTAYLVNKQITAVKAEAYLEPKQTSMAKLFLVNNLLFFEKNFITDGRLSFKEAPENNEIFKTKPTILLIIFCNFTIL